MSRRNGLRFLARALALVSLVAVVAACGDTADRPADAVQFTGGPGQILYLTYCQSCHGAGGRGDGPTAAALRVPPADLTGLWREYGTPLDRARVAEYIDGRSLLDAYGGREMPIWGDEFFEDAPSQAPNVEQMKRRLIDVLVEYLETLQSEQQT